MSQMFQFDPAPTRPTPGTTRLRLLVTAKVAPRPTEWQEETVHAIGLSTDPHRPGWIRLYPVSPRDLTGEERFQTYDLISVDAEPARDDPRRESWRPVIRTLTRELHLKQWHRRREWLDPYAEVSMCRLDQDARERAGGRSIALVRPSDVDELVLTAHPGWSAEQRRRLWAYLHRVGPGEPADAGALESPRFSGAYRYRCRDRECQGHQQPIGDWEFVALQRRLAGVSDAELRQALAATFLDRMCGPDRAFAFYVGRGPGSDREFRVLGGYWPPKW